jgi:hypothetical protein
MYWRATESGQLLLDLVQHGDVAEWALWINSFGDTVYRAIWGDKDTYALAFGVAGKAHVFNQLQVRQGEGCKRVRWLYLALLLETVCCLRCFWMDVLVPGRQLTLQQLPAVRGWLKAWSVCVLYRSVLHLTVVCNVTDGCCCCLTGPSCWSICMAAQQCACQGNRRKDRRLAVGWHGAVRCLGTTSIPAQVIKVPDPELNYKFV